MSSRSTTRKRKPGVMKRSVSPRRRCSAPLARAPPTRARAGVVVPTATMRPPRARASRDRRRRRRRRPRTTRCACACSARSSLRTGWNVPAPTCSVTAARSTPRARARRAARRRSAAPPSARRPRRAARRTRSGSARRRRRRRRASMYGGSGTWPWRSSSASGSSRKAQPEQRARRCPAAAEHLGVEARRRSATTLPAFGDLLARTWATRLRRPCSTRSTSASTAPPLALTPNRRALITRGVVERPAGRRRAAAPGRSRKTRSTRRVAAAVEQARGAALGGRMLGDQLGRQREVEIAQA